MSQEPQWQTISRPGYFGRRRDSIIAGYNTRYGNGNWRLVWMVLGHQICTFEEACKRFYEESYYRYLKDRPEDLEFITQYSNCIDNAPTNIFSELDYTKQEAFSTHIQDIAIRNVLHRLGLAFTGVRQELLVIRSKDSDGFKFGPGNVPFHDPLVISNPSMCPKWAKPGSVEDFWQSNKWLQTKSPS